MAQTTEPTEDFMDFDESVSDPLDLSSITGSRAFPPQKILIYGLPGVGKTTFAATFPPPRGGGSTPNFVLSSRVPMGPNCHTPRSHRGGCANTRDAWHGGRPGRSWDETPGYGPYSGAWKSHTKTDPAAAAIRHTRCVQALTAIGICTDSSVIDVSGLGALEKQIAKVKRWRDAAAEITTKHRKLSAGARRDLDAMFHRMADALASLASPDDNTKFLTWGGYIYAAELLVWDCLNTCPQYAHGNEWRWLQQSAYTLSRQLEALDPAVAVHGTAIYADIAPYGVIL